MAFPVFEAQTPTAVERFELHLYKGTNLQGDPEQGATYRIVVLDQNGRQMNDFPWVTGDAVPYLEGTEIQDLIAIVNALIARAETALGITP